MGSARRFSCANDSGMADLTLYVRPTGSNTNTGLSLSQAVQTQAKAAQLADGYLAGDPDVSILVSLGGNLGIPTGGGAGDGGVFGPRACCPGLFLRASIMKYGLMVLRQAER